MCQLGPERGGGLWKGPGMICRSQGLRCGHLGGADRQRMRKKSWRNEKEVAAASSVAPGTADAGAAGSAAACWWLYVQPRGERITVKVEESNLRSKINWMDASEEQIKYDDIEWNERTVHY